MLSLFDKLLALFTSVQPVLLPLEVGTYCIEIKGIASDIGLNETYDQVVFFDDTNVELRDLRSGVCFTVPLEKFKKEWILV